MALTSQAGSAFSAASVNTLAVSNVTASAGDTLLVMVVINNATTSITSVTDSAGNTYSQEALLTYNPGSNPLRLGIYSCVGLGAALAAGTVTVNFSASNVSPSIQVYRVQPGAGGTISVVSVDTTGTNGSSGTSSGNATSVTNGDTIFAVNAWATGLSSFSGAGFAPDGDTTNGSWSTFWAVATGNQANRISVFSQYKTVTATGNQTHDVTIATASGSRNWQTSNIVLRETVPANIAADAGTYSLTGTAAGVKLARRLAAATGGYSLTGQTAALKHGRKIAAGSGGYSLTGANAGLRHGWRLAASAGAYTFTGADAAFILASGQSITADPGSYLLTGQTASLKRSRHLTAGAGAYSLSGQATSLRMSRRVAAASGGYVLAGTDIILIKREAPPPPVIAGSTSKRDLALAKRLRARRKRLLELEDAIADGQRAEERLRALAIRYRKEGVDLQEMMDDWFAMNTRAASEVDEEETIEMLLLAM